MNQNSDSRESVAGPGFFDRMIGSLDGLPDVEKTKESPIRTVPPLGVGGSQLWIIQTFRQRNIGDTIFLEHVSEAGTVRLVIPPQVSDRIASQRDQLTGKVRSKASKAVAADRKARGLLPGFMKTRGSKKKKAAK